MTIKKFLQIRQQSSHFLRGFQQLIQKEWIDMFNEHELQVWWRIYDCSNAS